MTLDDLAASLPNGFHDSMLKSVNLDYSSAVAKLYMDIWIGDLDATTDSERERYRQAEICLYGLKFWVCEPPSPDRQSDAVGKLRIDVGAIEKLDQSQISALPPTPSGCFVNWIFVSEWNAFIFIAAQDAELSWLE